ncbi:hypothetical protein PR048_032270, partial [Dryococelus australis]
MKRERKRKFHLDEAKGNEVELSGCRDRSELPYSILVAELHSRGSAYENLREKLEFPTMLYIVSNLRTFMMEHRTCKYSSRDIWT